MPKKVDLSIRNKINVVLTGQRWAEVILKESVNFQAEFQYSKCNVFYLGRFTCFPTSQKGCKKFFISGSWDESDAMMAKKQQLVINTATAIPECNHDDNRQITKQRLILLPHPVGSVHL